MATVFCNDVKKWIGITSGLSGTGWAGGGTCEIFEDIPSPFS